ncbi:hypothetical protein [Luethyella okanaganae]|uniref:ABC transporter ATP-binding protein n=1 Tax=Luethyella okanaganae TaxID=69372 RepID=A0ABW1VEB7_9MICO
MTQPMPPANQPSRRDILRPVEMLVGAGIAGVFVGLVVLLATRELLLSVIALGVAFIVVLVVLAMFAMTWKPDAEETADLDEQDRDSGH